MRQFFRITNIVLAISLLCLPAFAVDNCANLPAYQKLAANGLEKVPGMGWSPNWAFTSSVTEADIKAQSDLMVTDGLLAAGYNIVSISDWWATRPSGTLVANTTTFPDGMAATIAYIHADGLLAGIYSSPYTTTCAGDAGSGTYEQTDANTFASWGADYLWYDGCSVASLYASCWSTEYKQVWQLMSQAVRNTGRPMIMHMGTNDNPVGSAEMNQDWSWAKDAGYNEVYPIKTDVPANGGTGWGTITTTLLSAAVGFHSYEQPGYFPMCDNLLGATEASGIATLTDAQAKAQFGLYALWGCPLYLSMDLSTLTTAELNVYRNPGVIAVDQDSLAHAGILYSQQSCGATTPRGNCQVWVKPLHDGSWAIGLLNIDGASAHTIVVNFTNFGGTPDVTDLWAASDLGTMTSYSTTVASNSIAMIKVTPAAGAAHTITNTQLENTAIQ